MNHGNKQNGFTAFAEQVMRYRHLLVPVAFLGLLVVLVVPMPPLIMDVLISANISLAAIILLTTIYMDRPLDFSVFPSLLLATTLFRLVLNIASTRLILTADATTPAEAGAVAGEVIQAFGSFVASESLVVGAIIFLILVIVQFVVITKGANRMSEVAARFTLDAMPGKQMAIDADLSSGLIDENTARSRRETVMREADFYGAMDGASKFVRGDAIAAIIITIINILGGLAIGWLSKGWTIAESAQVFTRLTIGDGLVSQVPAFIIAIAAGLIVARTGGKQTIGDEIPRQLSSQPIALFLISGFLCVLAFTGLPTVPLLGAAVILAGLAGAIQFISKQEAEKTASQKSLNTKARASSVEELLHIDSLEIEIGINLIPLADEEHSGDLLKRIASIRSQLALDLGLIVPPVRIRDHAKLDSNFYRVKLRGAIIGSGKVMPDRLMALDSGNATGQLDGEPGMEPAFGLAALWIKPEQRQEAAKLNYTIVEPTGVIATHLTELIRQHADELLTRQDVAHLLDKLKESAPKLVEEVIPNIVKPATLQKVLHNLLREHIPIRDLAVIVETLGDWAPQTQDVAVLTEYVRNALRRTISSLYAEADANGKESLYCITVDPSVEELISGYIDRSPTGTTLTMPPTKSRQIAQAVSRTGEPLLRAGHQLIVLASPTIRAQLKQILDAHLPGATVISYNEIVKGLDVESMGLVEVSGKEGVLIETPAATREVAAS